MTRRRSAGPCAARVSRTATLAAGIRAHHRRWHRDPILDDAHAVRLVSPFWRQVVHNRLTGNTTNADAARNATRAHNGAPAPCMRHG